MQTDAPSPRPTYRAPVITDHGDLQTLTAAGQPYGQFDGNYSQGQTVPPGGGGNSSTP